MDKSHQHALNRKHEILQKPANENFSDIFLPENQIVPAASIPAADNGNSPDGQKWLNPSGNQLIRACRRNQKSLRAEDALAMAATHTAVTSETWESIMMYERLHKCPNVRLVRFRGLGGQFSPKSKLFNALGAPLPFDRHDWIVDRCGKEIRYVIDYYAVKDNDTDGIDYYIDARPALNVGGAIDRIKIAFKRLTSR